MAVHADNHFQRSDGIVDSSAMLSGKGVDQINLYKLLTYLQESKLARKVESYALHKSVSDISTSKAQGSIVDTSRPILHQLSTILLALTHPSSEGRLFFSKDVDASQHGISLKFQLLDPSPHFLPILRDARAIVLAGGTMSPFSDYTQHLLPSLPADRLTTLSCGHVISAKNLLAWNLSKGPGSVTFEFNHKNKGNVEMIDELGRALLNICSVVPDGVVVFFSSYAFLDLVVAQWSNAARVTKSPFPTPATKTIFERLNAKKPIFMESKTTTSEVTLAAYAQAIDTGQGGLLLSVVGGKMSEGINFSDALGRCVLIIGLPYPNIMSAEWRARIAFVEERTKARLEAENASHASLEHRKLGKEEIHGQAKEQGREYYENACMRAVNQSVGRAIRHKGDYAAIIMVDVRYESARVQGKLPGWIKSGMVEGAGQKGFAQLMGRLGLFFRCLKDS